MAGNSTVCAWGGDSSTIPIGCAIGAGAAAARGGSNSGGRAAGLDAGGATGLGGGMIDEEDAPTGGGISSFDDTTSISAWHF